MELEGECHSKAEIISAVARQITGVIVTKPYAVDAIRQVIYRLHRLSTSLAWSAFITSVAQIGYLPWVSLN
jgi:hypothetical protein